MSGGSERSSFASFYEQTARSVYSFARVIAGEDGEDLAAEAYARALARWREVSGYERPDAWVRRVLVNLTVSRARRAKVQDLFRSRHTARVALPPSDAIEDKVVVAQALQRLSPKQRAVVVLRYLEDLSTREVAAALAISESTATTHLRRALEKLQQELGDGPGEPPDLALRRGAAEETKPTPRQQLGTRSRPS